VKFLYLNLSLDNLLALKQPLLLIGLKLFDELSQLSQFSLHTGLLLCLLSKAIYFLVSFRQQLLVHHQLL